VQAIRFFRAKTIDLCGKLAAMGEQELRALLGANLKRFRNRREWPQAKLAGRLKIFSNFVSDIETGNGRVSPLTLVKRASALDVEVYEFFKSEELVNSDVKELMARFAKDISVALSQSLTKSVQKSLNKTFVKTLDESLQNVCKQYFGN
jgi:transcriptional regulator with XRE-family HTH domain